MSELNSVWLFALCPKRSRPKIRRALEQAIQEHASLFQGEVVTAELGDSVLALSGCLHRLCGEGDLDFLVDAVKGKKQVDLYWHDVSGMGVAARYSEVVPWSVECHEVQLPAEIAVKVKNATQLSYVTSTRLRLGAPLTISPQRVADPTRAINPHVDLERRNSHPLHELCLALVGAMGTSTTAASLLNDEFGCIGSIEIRSLADVRMMVDPDRVFSAILSRCTAVREFVDETWADQPSGKAAAESEPSSAASMNRSALEQWRGVLRLVDEDAAIQSFRAGRDRARRDADSRLALVIDRNLASLVAWQPGADVAATHIGRHNVLTAIARFKTAGLRDAALFSLQRLTEERIAEYHVCQAPWMGELAPRAAKNSLIYEACLGAARTAEDLRFLHVAMPGADAVDLCWSDPVRGRVCQAEGALSAPLEFIALEFIGRDGVSRKHARQAMEGLICGDFGLDGGMLSNPITFFPGRSREIQRLTFDMPLASAGVPSDLPSDWAPFVERAHAAVRSGSALSVGFHSSASVALAYLEGSVSKGGVRFWFDYDTHLERVKSHYRNAREYDEAGAWVVKTEDVSTFTWRFANGGRVGQMAGLATAYKSGQWGPVDERAAVLWFRRALAEMARQNDRRGEELVLRNFRDLLAHRPDLRNERDP